MLSIQTQTKKRMRNNKQKNKRKGTVMNGYGGRVRAFVQRTPCFLSLGRTNQTPVGGVLSLNGLLLASEPPRDVPASYWRPPGKKSAYLPVVRLSERGGQASDVHQAMYQRQGFSVLVDSDNALTIACD
jgi:hypothetical protein